MMRNIVCRFMLLNLLIIGFGSCDLKEKEVQNKEVQKKEVQVKEVQKKEISKTKNEDLFKSALSKHLNAVKAKDLIALKSTLSPNANMELIQPSSEIVYSVDGFMKFHKEWFEVPNWTVETKILSSDIGDRIGVATTEFLYKEPERNGKPYFNRLIVSYTLEKINDNWYVIKDHASSVEKTEN